MHKEEEKGSQKGTLTRRCSVLYNRAIAHGGLEGDWCSCRKWREGRDGGGFRQPMNVDIPDLLCYAILFYSSLL